MAVKPEQIAEIRALLPTAAEDDYAWDDAKIISIITDNNYNSTQVVRAFWLERVTETAEYIDIGKPLSQIHSQAKGMLDYWDNVLKLGSGALLTGRAISFGEIDRS
jgi:hypothetical protein